MLYILRTTNQIVCDEKLCKSTESKIIMTKIVKLLIILTDNFKRINQHNRK